MVLMRNSDNVNLFFFSVCERAAFYKSCNLIGRPRAVHKTEGTVLPNTDLPSGE